MAQCMHILKMDILCFIMAGSEFMVKILKCEHAMSRYHAQLYTFCNTYTQHVKGSTATFVGEKFLVLRFRQKTYERVSEKIKITSKRRVSI
jgi:hypothetical protein